MNYNISKGSELKNLLRREVKPLTNMKRITISVPEELENAIYGLRKQETYTRCSKSEMIRKLVEIGLKAEARKKRQSDSRQ